MSNAWTTVKTKAPVGGYVPPSQRKPKEPTFDELFPEGLLPVAPVKKSAWTSDFKAAIEKKTDVIVPDRGNSILASYTNPITGKTTIVRDMPHHPHDNVQEPDVVIPNIVSIIKKTAAKRRVLDDDDDSFVQAETESHVEETDYDHYSEEPEEEKAEEDYVSD
jgi:hypothetical protein